MTPKNNADAVFYAYHIIRYSAPAGWHVDQYRNEGKWITVGGRAEGGKRHAGGTRIRLDQQGRITAGPSALKGRRIADIAPSDLSRKRKESAPGQMHLFGWGTKRGLGKPSNDRQQNIPFEEPRERHPLPPTVRRLADGRAVGHALISVDELAADPNRFQYKVSNIVDRETGTSAELKEVRRFRPEFAGQILVWRDPKDGTNYVVNGHHRFELAKRSGYKGGIPAFFIDARNDQEARAVGALANIAEGRGTAHRRRQVYARIGSGPR